MHPQECHLHPPLLEIPTLDYLIKVVLIYFHTMHTPTYTTIKKVMQQGKLKKIVSLRSIPSNTTKAQTYFREIFLKTILTKSEKKALWA